MASDGKQVTNKQISTAGRTTWQTGRALGIQIKQTDKSTSLPSNLVGNPAYVNYQLEVIPEGTSEIISQLLNTLLMTSLPKYRKDKNRDIFTVVGGCFAQ